MIKGFFIFGISAFITLGALAQQSTKVATQDWVKKYFTENSTPKKFVSKATIETNENKVVSFTYPASNDKDALSTSNKVFGIQCVQYTNVIFTAVSSTVSNVAEGTQWRVTNEGILSTNKVIPQLTYQVLTSGNLRQLKKDTSLTDTNNVNKVFQLKAENVATGDKFVGAKDTGFIYLFNTTNRNESIKLQAQRVSEQKAREVFLLDSEKVLELPQTNAPPVLKMMMKKSLKSAKADETYQLEEFKDDCASINNYAIQNMAFYTYEKGVMTDIKICTFADGAKIILDAELDDYKYWQVNAIPELEYFLDTQNWDMTFVKDSYDRPDFDLIQFTEGESLTRKKLQSSPEWIDFATSVYTDFIEALEQLFEEHECTPNPEDDCKCIFFDSVHCRHGRGKSVDTFEAPYDFVHKDADELHNWIIIGFSRRGVYGILDEITDTCCLVCQNNDKHSEHCQDPEACSCYCGAQVIHKPSKSNCQCVCGELKGKSDSEEWHVPLKNRCGCSCGAMLEWQSKKWHKHEKIADTGDDHCLCMCERFHKFLYNEDNLCPLVCGDCHERNESGEFATIDDHWAKTYERKHLYPGGSIDCCGCECGNYGISAQHSGDFNVQNVAKFHYRKAGTCRCLGDGRGGRWHFKLDVVNACPKICAYCGNLAAQNTKEPDVIDASVYDHTRAEHRCGCACRYMPDTVPVVDGFHYHDPFTCGCECGEEEPFEHRFIDYSDGSGNCICNCNTKHRNMSYIDMCFGICRGCELWCGTKDMCDVSELQNPKMEHHTPSEYNCGCQCGDVNEIEVSYLPEDSKFHTQSLINKCMCSCGMFHKFYDDEGKCPFCKYCDLTKDKTLLRGGDNAKDVHVQADNACKCKCEHYNCVDPFHQFKDDKCLCVCGNTGRDHLWRDKAEVSHTTCEICTAELTITRLYSVCERCHETSESTTTTEGHNPYCDEHACLRCGCYNCHCFVCQYNAPDPDNNYSIKCTQCKKVCYNPYNPYEANTNDEETGDKRNNNNDPTKTFD